jgi:YD repeat-containing protein
VLDRTGRFVSHCLTIKKSRANFIIIQGVGMKYVFYLGTAIALLSASTANAAETITYKYDAKGRLIEVKRTGTVNNNVQTNYTHDKANNRKTVVVTGSGN